MKNGMKKLLIVVAIVAVALSGCATYQAWRSGASDAQMVQANCRDAEVAYPLAKAILSKAIGFAEVTYWSTYVEGAKQKLCQPSN